MKLPKLTSKQAEILTLLYRYRFLNRIQIQQLMGHKDYHRINAWLKDLTEKEYINRIYSTHFLEKTKPATYYLGINGIRYLKPQTVTTKDEGEVPKYPLTELRKRYRENDRTAAFRTRSILLADSCIELKAKTSQKLRYGIATQANFSIPRHGYHFLTEAEGIAPSLCIIKHEYGKGEDPDDEGTITNYLLEVFDPTTPRYTIRYRIKKYVEYIEDDEWECGDNDPPPLILLVVPRTTDLIYAKRRLKKTLEDKWYDDEDEEEEGATERPHIRFATMEQLQKQGITAKIWEEGRKVYGL